MDRVVYADELFVEQVGSAARPLAEQVEAARQAHPEGTVASIIPPLESDQTTRVMFSMPELGEKQHTAYIDPYTNEVRGALTTWFNETPLMTWLDDLHRNLHLGTLGRYYSELAASWLWVLVLGGLTLWLNRQWKGRRLRRTVLPDLAATKGVRRTRGWHAAIGVWLAVGLLTLSATGPTWSRYAGANFDLLQSGFNAVRIRMRRVAVGGAAVTTERPLYEQDPAAWHAYLAEGNAAQARKRVSADLLIRDRPGRLLLVIPATSRTGTCPAAWSRPTSHRTRPPGSATAPDRASMRARTAADAAGSRFTCSSRPALSWPNGSTSK